MKYRILATDYDGTLATHGAVDEATISTLRRAREAGIRLFMVTGREIADLKTVFSHLDLFEQIVAENGALIFDPAHGTEQILAPTPPPEFVKALQERLVPMSVGRTIVATVEPYEHVVLEVIHQLGLEWHIIFNKGSVMVLPSSVNKATGLTALLKQLSIAPAQVVGVGDAENDQAFLQMCGYPAAVANALPSLKECAAYVTEAAHGAGVSELISRMLDDSLPELKPKEPAAGQAGSGCGKTAVG